MIGLLQIMMTVSGYLQNRWTRLMAYQISDFGCASIMFSRNRANRSLCHGWSRFRVWLDLHIGKLPFTAISATNNSWASGNAMRNLLLFINRFCQVTLTMSVRCQHIICSVIIFDIRRSCWWCQASMKYLVGNLHKVCCICSLEAHTAHWKPGHGQWLTGFILAVVPSHIRPIKPTFRLALY